MMFTLLAVIFSFTTANVELRDVTNQSNSRDASNCTKAITTTKKSDVYLEKGKRLTSKLIRDTTTTTDKPWVIINEEDKKKDIHSRPIVSGSDEKGIMDGCTRQMTTTLVHPGNKKKDHELVRLYCKSEFAPKGTKKSQDEVDVRYQMRLPYAYWGNGTTIEKVRVGYAENQKTFHCLSEQQGVNKFTTNKVDIPNVTGSPLLKCETKNIFVDSNFANRICADVSWVFHRCGDGFVDADHGEDCDPNQTDKSTWGNKACNPQTCKFEENGKATFAKTTTTSSVSKIGDKIDWVITVTGDEQKTTYNAGFIDILPKGLKFEGF